MTNALKLAVHKAEKLPEPKQEILALVINEKVDELQERAEAEALARLSESSFAKDWDNEEDAVYDNWKEIYGVS